MPDLPQRSLAETATALRDGSLSARDLAEAAIARFDAVGNGLDAYREWRPDLLRQAAALADEAFAAGVDLGPLQGVPVSVKDLYAVAGYRTFAGTPAALPPEEWEQDGPLVTRLRSQFAAFTGKTHTVELAFGGLGINPHWPIPRNPWDAKVHRTPGGSSSGAGVTLQTGTALLALGTDTAGSVRLPASSTGTVGLKTSFGRWPLDRIVPLSPTLDTPGILARTVADIAYAFAAIDPVLGNDREAFQRMQSFDPYGLRIGVPEGLVWEDCSPGVAEAVETGLRELEAAGARLVPVTLSECDAAWSLFRKGGVQAVELLHFLKTSLPDWIDRIDPVVRGRMDDAETLPAHEYLDRRRIIAEATASARRHFEKADVLAGPTIALTPPPVTEVMSGDAYRAANILTLRNTSLANYLGFCALSLPVGLDAAGMPVGLHLMGPGGEDQRLVAVGRACEAVLGTAFERIGRPPLASA